MLTLNLWSLGQVYMTLASNAFSYNGYQMHSPTMKFLIDDYALLNMNIIVLIDQQLFDYALLNASVVVLIDQQLSGYILLNTSIIVLIDQ